MGRTNDGVIAALRDLVLSGEVIDGRLPPERELSDRLGIGRPAVREQLQALASIGVLQRDVGRGTFIQRPQGADLGNLLDLALAADHVAVEELMVVRRALEREAARLAASNIDDESIVRLTELCDEMRTPASPDHGVAADHAFHYLLLSRSGNRAITFFADALSSALHRSLIERRLAIRSDRKAQIEMARAHDRIVAALRSGDAEKSALAMDKHFDTYNRLARRVAGT